MTELARKLSAMEWAERADFILDVLAADDEDAEDRLAAALDELDGALAILDALGRARQRRAPELEAAIWRLEESLA